MASYHNVQIETNRINQCQENRKKLLFRPKLSPKPPILGPANSFSTLYPPSATARYHNIQNQQKLMLIDQENGQKPHLGPFLALNGPF